MVEIYEKKLRNFNDGRFFFGYEISMMVGFVLLFLYKISKTVSFVLYEISKTVGLVMRFQ